MDGFEDIHLVGDVNKRLLYNNDGSVNMNGMNVKMNQIMNLDINIDKQQINKSIKLEKQLTVKRGARLKYIRVHFLKLSIKALSALIGIHNVNLRRLESGITILKQRIAEILCMKFAEMGIHVEGDWLMHGEGAEPILIKNEIDDIQKELTTDENNKLYGVLHNIIRRKNENLINYNEYKQISDNCISSILSILYKKYYVSCVINDKHMDPEFKKGDKVSGYWKVLNESNYHTINGQNMIVQRDNSILMVRKVFYDEVTNCYLLVCCDLKYKPEIVSINTKLGNIIATLYTNI